MQHYKHNLWSLSMILLGTLSFWPFVSKATLTSREPILVNLSVGEVRIMRFRSDVDRVTVANPKMIDIRGIGSRQLQISGRNIGETSILVFREHGSPMRLVVSVSVPTEGLSLQLRSLFPGETITVQAMGNTVVLSGEVSDPVISERCSNLAEAYFKRAGTEIRLLNFLSIKGRQQVQLRVKIAEVSRNALRKLGTNLWFRREQTGSDGSTEVTSAGGLLSPGNQLQSDLARTLSGGGLTPSAGPEGTQISPIPLLGGPLGANAFGFHFATSASSVLPLSIALNLLQGQGLAKILSEPTLVAYSGAKANFLVGGEFPMPVPQSLNAIAIQYKKYGVQLTFTPTVLANQTIHLQVSVSVSERDQTNVVLIQGTSVPSLTTRHSETTIRLKNGQSFAIAGLLQDRVESYSRKIPLLGDIPIIGILFRQDSFDRQERELVILATAHLVRPLRPGEVPPLPGEDEISDPGSIAFFLLGTTDPMMKKKHRSKPAGPVGYSR